MMTRENKLSIVVAFGLLIFVGMLVADHFSIASHREVADLGSNVSTPPLLSPTVLLDGPPLPMRTKTNKNSSGDKVHIVHEGETLRTICRDFYGDSGLASCLASWNNLSDPNTIEQGVKLSLPSRTSLVTNNIVINNTKKENTSPKPVPEKHKMGTYKVKPGDTLSEIAQKVMGTMKKTQLLIDTNKDVLPNPDKIRPGMILRYPMQSS
jgi:LysM repeat protein